jgi:hypothetical protein
MPDGMGVTEIRRLKQLEDENGKLKKIVADLTLGQNHAAGYIAPKVVSPPFDMMSQAICTGHNRN